jgi:hypothetical protein
MDDRSVHRERDLGRCLGDRLEDRDLLLFAKRDHDNVDVFDHEHLEHHHDQHDKYDQHGEHGDDHDIDDGYRHHLDHS